MECGPWPCGCGRGNLQELQWTSVGGGHFVDDERGELDTQLDPPQAFADAARRSVERLYYDRPLKEMPGACPPDCDIHHHSTFAAQDARAGGRELIHVNPMPYIRPLYRNAKRLHKVLPQWLSNCTGNLASAITGGPWPQARKAKLPGFWRHPLPALRRGRRHCPTTKFVEGWAFFGAKVQAFVGELTERRAYALQHRGILTVRIATAAPHIPSGGWRWLTKLPNSSQDGLRWFTDGSRRYATERTLSTTGCGVAVLDADDAFIAYATATPSPWFKSAGAADARAFLLTLKKTGHHLSYLPIVWHC